VTRPLLTVVRITATTVIAGIAAYVSYWHMVGVVDRYGETGSSPYLIPVTVDGLIVVASVSLVELAAKLRSLEAPAPVKVEQVVEMLGGPVTVAVPVVAPVVGVPAAVAPMRGGPRRGRSGPQVSGPSNAGLNGTAVLQETPTA